MTDREIKDVDDDVAALRRELDDEKHERLRERRAFEAAVTETQNLADRSAVDAEQRARQATGEVAAHLKALEREMRATLDALEQKLQQTADKDQRRGRKLLARVEALVETVEARIGQAEGMAREVRDNDAGALGLVQRLEQRVAALEAGDDD